MTEAENQQLPFGIPSKTNLRLGIRGGDRNLDAGNFTNSSRQLGVQEALDWYISEFLVGKKRDRTIAEYQKDLEKIFAAIPIKRVSDLSLSYLDHYVAMRTPLLSPATLCRRLSALSSFLTALVSRDLIPFNVMGRFERPELVDRLPDYLSPEQVHRLRSVCAGNGRVLAIVILLLEAGLRAGELVRLSLDDVELESTERRIIVRGFNSKNRKDRIIYLSGETARALQTYLRQRGDSTTPVLFLNRFGEPFTINALERLLKRYFVKAGFPSLRVHDLRHTFAVNFLKQRKPLNVLQKTLGHANLSTTSLYVQVNNEEMKSCFAVPLFK
jgi:site-specific recombinase XerD